ncbi:hypothetical protein KJ603_02565 [Patescibacteria group bacterium]|nr:hypothetical protein [Patescibacteria group bacterium]
MDSKDNKNLLILFGIILTISIAGISLGILYSHLPGNTSPENKQDCESADGQWSGQENYCQLPSKESGEICTDGGQCQSGVCFPPELTETQMSALSENSLNNRTGTCYPEELVTGCVEQVLNGTVSKESMCLDS